MNSRNWVFRDDGIRPGVEQMAIDAGLLDAAASGALPGPVFRIYGWNPPAVSLGFHQDPERELDLEAILARGYDVVTRPTGGRAILHRDELTYAVVAPVDDPAVGGSIRESHCRISRLFLEVLSRLGVPAGLASDCSPAGGIPADRTRLDRSTPCFATAIGSELVVSGRKILGSAQRRKNGVFLQHGSLLLGDGHLDLANLLRLDSAKQAARYDELVRMTTTLSRELSRPVTREEVRPVLEAALTLTLGREVHFQIAGVLTPPAVR